MSDPLLGAIKMYGFNYAPRGYSFCNGAKLSKKQYKALYEIIKGQFGEDDDSFHLPDLQCRIPIGDGAPYTVGDRGGVEHVSLNTQQMPQHTHHIEATTDEATEASPEKHYLAKTGSELYHDAQKLESLAGIAVTSTGNANNLHPNWQPSLAINFCIALVGTYPSGG